MQLILPNQKVNQVDPNQNKLTRIFVTYIDKVIANDIANGRSEKNLFPGEQDSIKRQIDEIRKDGGRVFTGGGNIFLLKIENTLKGWQGKYIHIRGLAQRTFMMKEDLI
jgi:hypothetical protein